MHRSEMLRLMSAKGHERRSPHQTAARPFPLYPGSDRSGEEAQYVAKGHFRDSCAAAIASLFDDLISAGK